MISSLNAPKSSCGAFSCANAVILSQRLAAGEDAASILTALQDQTVVEPELRRAMQYMSEARRAYVQAHKDDFKSFRDVDTYVSAWAANYEISDYLRLEAKAGRLPHAELFFLRYNQWSERNTATHEEAARLVEEEPFGGHNTGDKANVQLEVGASRFIVESFLPDGGHCLERTDEFLKRVGQLRNAVFILDLNGHFATAVASGPIEDPKLIVCNTTRGDYIRGGGGGGSIPIVAFDLAYPAV